MGHRSIFPACKELKREDYKAKTSLPAWATLQWEPPPHQTKQTIKLPAFRRESVRKIKASLKYIPLSPFPIILVLEYVGLKRDVMSFLRERVPYHSQPQITNTLPGLCGHILQFPTQCFCQRSTGRVYWQPCGCPELTISRGQTGVSTTSHRRHENLWASSSQVPEGGRKASSLS